MTPDQQARSLRGAILLVVVTLALALAIMLSSLPAHSAPRHCPHVSRHVPRLPPVRYRRVETLDAWIGRGVFDILTRR